MAEPDNIPVAPPAGEEIHMPAPSLIPVINAAGLATAIVGITISPIMIVGGLLVFFALDRRLDPGRAAGVRRAPRRASLSRSRPPSRSPDRAACGPCPAEARLNPDDGAANRRPGPDSG